MTPAQTFSRANPPETLCLLRLSALGDITHVLPTLRTLQKHWPTTKITWIIGKSEYQLVKAIDNVNFIIFDKSAGRSSYLQLKKQIKQHLNSNAFADNTFDILLHMQLSVRASIASLFIPAKIKLGFDKERAKDLQSIFCSQKIIPKSTRQHVLDSFLEFPGYFGLEPEMRWQLPVAQSAIESIEKQLPANKKIFIINPCAVAKSKNWRNWTNEGYAAIADFVAEQHDMQVVLTGGNSQLEKNTAKQIIRLCKTAKPLNLIAKTNIDELTAILHLANIVLAPDTGPVHIASALDIDTIGLYASTNPDRAGPYNHQQYVVNKYPQALLKYNNKTVGDARWGERIKTAECMALITVDDVKQQINKIIEKQS
ncbi:ADP-heptose--lipooligosaccharide heptosyltransferase II [hydrothermal vent metagenome]|uniref:ADP-heptose--lipooligosaccharide heptosyltransferase II n=1 Tax=hydrothermal vent metagenome TaxID=652676 RepID=A0A3B0WRX5_9ZZZZ